jgi:multidrug resistance efflux pump
MIKLSQADRKQFIELFETKRIALEGNILKVLDPGEDADFKKYLDACSEKDRETRKRRLDMTKQIQQQNQDLLNTKESLESYQEELKHSLEGMQKAMSETQEAKDEAERLRLDAEQSKEEAEAARVEAEQAREEAENAKKQVENDLDILQRKTQNELIGTIVKVSLFVIVGVGFVTTGVYLLSIYSGKDTQVIASTWSNIVGILLTNAFSIVGTIMGIKYATSDHQHQ